MAGTLYVVATPLGNLEDITFRAARILREADLVACEDTRTSRKLLDHIQSPAPLTSLHEHNEYERAAELVDRLRQGATIALISDAGTPLVSDPGFRLVRAAVDAGVAVVPIPGPSAVMAGLMAAALPTDAFAFAGFLPPKSTGRRQTLAQWRDVPATLIFFESPHRIAESLADIAAVYGETPLVLARELTKLHEEWLRGTAAEISAVLARRDTIRGEFTVLVDRRLAAPAPALTVEEEAQALLARGFGPAEVAKELAKRHSLPKREAYQLVERLRKG